MKMNGTCLTHHFVFSYSTREPFQMDNNITHKKTHYITWSRHNKLKPPGPGTKEIMLMWLLSALVHGIKNQFGPKVPRTPWRERERLALDEWSGHRLLWMARQKKSVYAVLRTCSELCWNAFKAGCRIFLLNIFQPWKYSNAWCSEDKA